MYYMKQSAQAILDSLKEEYKNANENDRYYIKTSSVIMRLSGPSNKDTRKEIYKIITGEKGTNANSGINALRELIINHIKN